MTEAGPWLILGSSPSMPDYVDHAFDRWRGLGSRGPGAWCTTNAGVFEAMRYMLAIGDAWDRRPDYYGIVELETLPRFKRYIDVLVAWGTKLVTTSRTVNAGLQLPADVVLPVPAGQPTDNPWQPGEYRCCASTGAYLVQFAVNSGATHVIMVGMDGYTSHGGDLHVDTFDGRLGAPAAAEHQRTMTVPLLQQVAERSQQVKFEQFGRPTFGISARNWSVRSEL